MGYFKLDKSILRNTQRAISLELLDANKQGAYISMSVPGCNTRKYHGLLVVPIKNMGSTNHVLLSTLDESIVLNGVEFRIGMHQYGENNFTPNGNKYLCGLTYDRVPCLTYHLADVILSKELVLSTVESRVYIRYTLLDSKADVLFRFNPNLAFRNVDTLCQANYNATTDYKEIDNGITTCLYSGYPSLSMQFSRNVRFVSKPSWNRGIEYFNEKWRGYNFKEDLFVPGYFTLSLKKGESVVFTAGLEEVNSASIMSQYRAEMNKKGENSDVKQTLRNSVSKFFLKKSSKELYLRAGFPWFGCRARDMFIALPGVTLPFDDAKTFDSIMNSAIPGIQSFIEGKGNKTKMEGLDNPDVLLWVVRALQLYAEKYGEEQTWLKYDKILTSIMTFLKGGKHPLIECHENGLLYVKEGWNRPVTWMNAIAPNGNPITPRSGYVIEINALWYNVMRFYANMAQHLNMYDVANEYNDFADALRLSFTPVFWNGTYLFDFVDGDHHENSVRPNMLFAVSLPYSPLDEIQKKMVVDMSTKELLTPKGVRSLSPKSNNYHGWCGGDQVTRDYEAFQGAVYPWLMGAYVEAYLKVYQQNGYDFAKRSLVAFTGELFNDCLGTLSEMYDATQPFTGRGGMSYLINISEVIRAFYVVENYNR
ncbi:MAG: glycogen debranching enzyme N-terminal domain-containing protein [Paludibacteraceae bacterium]|nr:glycogen debranching enzyme N-terminal domain-containing protein [Paludibacteraceae bacterium]